MPYGLSENILRQLTAVFDKYIQINEVILYGSRAKGNYNEGSDIDLTIVGDQLDFSILQQVNTDIDQLNLPWLFDISDYKTINNKKLIDHINRVGITIYKEEQ
ncbi:Nucleotidyltransferase domain-containing protein [Draconibacterium orientale]|uniref:DNA polymerase n=1 Tax=Draconibacterium orientale TaxID=1168034 RepID=X5E1J3_9BACT|nr:nucleotidyltransferase domain-containing protein [Draconibacterium orientale]AHW61310.1 DNA polymerase [Draconibacterium orientale]SEU05405.1 Nucleotidyltransferase domain-containing protein [Draconibacterium orientale]